MNSSVIETIILKNFRQGFFISPKQNFPHFSSTYKLSHQTKPFKFRNSEKRDIGKLKTQKIQKLMCIIVDKQGKKLLWLFFIIGLVTSLPFIIVDFIFTHGIISRNQQLCLYADISLTQQTTYNSAYHVLSVNEWCELLFVLTLLGMAVGGHFLHETKLKTLFLVSSILGSCWCLFHLSWCIYAVNINYAIIQIENLYPNFCERISPYFSSYIGFGLIVKSAMLMLFFITPKHEGNKENQGINPEAKNQETGNSVPSSSKSFPVESI